MKRTLLAFTIGMTASATALSCPEFLNTEMRKLSSKETVNFWRATQESQCLS